MQAGRQAGRQTGISTCTVWLIDRVQRQSAFTLTSRMPGNGDFTGVTSHMAASRILKLPVDRRPLRCLGR